MHEKLTFSWERFPALSILTSLIAGGLLSKGIFFPLLVALLHQKKRLVVASLCLSFFTAALFTLNQKQEPKTGEVVALVSPHSLKKKGGRLSLRAVAPLLINEAGEEFENVKLFLSLPKRERPNFHFSYVVSGSLKKSSYGYFLHSKSWKKLHFSPSLVEARFALHERAKKLLRARIQDSDVQNYFIALVTGNIPCDFLRARFIDAGLIHILAISGFHFSWIIFLLSIPISLLFQRKNALICLLLFALLYFLFAGGSTAISRAFIATSVYLLSILFSRVTLPLNSLGLAGICSILIDPYSLFEISFALSFLATFAILTLYPLAKRASSFVYPKEEGSLPVWRRAIFLTNQFCILSSFVSLLIWISILPVSFFFFPFVPLFGLFYNLFFPITMMPTLILLIFAFFFEIFGPATWLWKAAEVVSLPFLEMVLYGKGHLFLLLKSPACSPHLLSLSAVFLFFVCLKSDALSHEEYLLVQDEVYYR